MMGRSKFSVQGKIGQGLDQDDVLDLFKAALMQDGEIFDFVPAADGSCQFKAAPNQNIYGIKGQMVPRFKDGIAHVSIEGRWSLCRSFWWFIHAFFTFACLPYVFFALYRFSKSQKRALSYGEDLIRQMRIMS